MDSREQAGRSTQLLESNNTSITQLAQQDKVPWYSKPNLRFLYFLMLPACMGAEMAAGFDASMINGLQSVSSWLEYFHHPRSAVLGFVVAVYPLGSVAAVPFVPFLADKMGRRYPMFLASIITIIGAIIQGFALNTSMFIVARFILGFANVIGVIAASALIAELSHPNERAIMSSLFCVPFDLGSVAAAGVVLGTYAMTSSWGWRLPSFLQVMPSLLQLYFISFLPESPRWLISKGRGSEAYSILVEYHAEGDENSEFVKAEYTQIKEALEAEQKTAKANWKDIFSTPGMRKRTTIAIFLGLSITWCGAKFPAYFLSPILDSIGVHDNRTKNIINFSRVSWSLMNGIVCAFIAPRYPRRRIFLVSAISLFVVFTAWTIASAEYSLTNNKIFARVVLVLIFLIIPGYKLAFSVMIYTYLVELFPFHVRARGISLYQWCFRIGGFTGMFMNPVGINAAGWKWYIIFCVWNAFGVVFVYFMLPETSGRTLEELTFLYESDQEAFGYSVIDTLVEHREIEPYYGTMDDHSRSGR